MDRPSSAGRRGAGRSLVPLLLGLATACSSAAGTPSVIGRPTGAVPVVTPSNAYGAFPYVSAGQRRTFRAFLACAADDGVHFVGPLIDSTGNGVFFRLAAGEREAPGTQGRVTADCPQSTVGLFGTPVGPAHARRFERIAKKFAACLREHGFPRHPTPTFGSGDPRTEFWQLPFSWSIPRFVAAVQACVDPLHSYLFST